MISKSIKRRRIIQEKIKHSLDCKWWEDWHNCTCGELDREYEESKKEEDTEKR